MTTRREFLLASVMAGTSAVALEQVIERVPLIKRVSVLPRSEMAVRRELRPIVVWRQALVPVAADADAFALHGVAISATGLLMHSMDAQPLTCWMDMGALVLRRQDVLEMRVLRDPRDT